MIKMIATQDTWLKRTVDPANELPPDRKKHVTKGTEYGVEKYERAANGHIKVTLAGGAGIWYIFDPQQGGHWTCDLWDDWQEDENDGDRVGGGKAITLPDGNLVHTDQPIIAGGYFTWGEATHGGDRVPLHVSHVNNIISLATHLQRFRFQIGQPFRVTSWYRPEPWNRKAGGARNSQHLTGKGVDIVVEGHTGAQLARKAEWWPGGLGIYPGNRAHILHLDIGPKRRWGF